MRKDKNEIIDLRMSGMSYKELSAKFNVSKSTLSNWFKNNDASQTIKSNLLSQNIDKSTIRIHNLNKIRGNLLEIQYQKAEKEALDFLKINYKNPLFSFGVGAYWGEGDKISRNSFRISNSDPEFIKLFIKFIFEVCMIDRQKMRIYLMIYDDSDPEEALKFWKSRLNTSRSHFAKPYVIKGRHKTKRLPFGTCILSVANSYLKRQMVTWLKELPKVL